MSTLAFRYVFGTSKRKWRLCSWFWRWSHQELQRQGMYGEFKSSNNLKLELTDWKSAKKYSSSEILTNLKKTRSFLPVSVSCFLVDSVSLSCSQSATTRPNTAHMFPLWGSTGNLARPRRIYCLLATNADDEMDLFCLPGLAMEIVLQENLIMNICF